MAKCVKCGNDLIYIDEEQVNYCPKCGAKYKTVSAKEPNETVEGINTETKKNTTNNAEPLSLFEQFKAGIKNHDNTTDELQHSSLAKIKRVIKPRWIVYLIAIALTITCLVVCATPISYNTRYVYQSSDYRETYAIVFQRDNICKTQSGSKTVGIELYYIEDNYINFAGNSRGMRVVDRTTLESYSGGIYKAEVGGEIFLIIITVIWDIFAIILPFVINKKKSKSKDNLKETE